MRQAANFNYIAGNVIATKGAKDVHALMSAEKGENITIIACCNAEGQRMLFSLMTVPSSWSITLKKKPRQILHHSGRTISRIQVGDLIAKSWKKATSVNTAIIGFQQTGIFPFNQDRIPEHFF